MLKFLGSVIMVLYVLENVNVELGTILSQDNSLDNKIHLSKEYAVRSFGLL